MSAPVSIKPKRGRSWAVWNKADRIPAQFFATRELAIEHAQYLAQSSPGLKFHVVLFDSKVHAQRVAA